MIYEVYVRTPKGPHPYKLVGHANVDFQRQPHVFVHIPEKLDRSAIHGDTPLDARMSVSIRTKQVGLQLTGDRVFITHGKHSWLRRAKWFKPISLPKEMISV